MNSFKIITIILIIFCIIAGFVFTFLKTESVKIELMKIYKTYPIASNKDANFYSVKSSEIYAKNIKVDGEKLLLIVENNPFEDQSYYRFYKLNWWPVILKEVISYVLPENSGEAFNSNFFQKDITGDKVDELFIKMESSASNVDAYQIFYLENNSFINIKKSGGESNWVIFDEIAYKNGNVVITTHAMNELGRTDYKLEKNILIPIKSVIFSFSGNSNGCDVKEKNAGDEKFNYIEHIQSCSSGINSFDKYF